MTASNEVSAGAGSTSADDGRRDPARADMLTDVRTPGEQLGDVEGRLLQTFGSRLGEAAVQRSMSMAVQAVRFFGDDPAQRGSLIERIARNELELLQEGRNERAWT